MAFSSRGVENENSSWLALERAVNGKLKRAGELKRPLKQYGHLDVPIVLAFYSNPCGHAFLRLRRVLNISVHWVTTRSTLKGRKKEVNKNRKVGASQADTKIGRWRMNRPGRWHFSSPNSTLDRTYQCIFRTAVALLLNGKDAAAPGKTISDLFSSYVCTWSLICMRLCILATPKRKRNIVGRTMGACVA